MAAAILKVSNCCLDETSLDEGYVGFAQASATHFVRNRTFQSFVFPKRAKRFIEIRCVVFILRARQHFEIPHYLLLQRISMWWAYGGWFSTVVGETEKNVFTVAK